RTRRPHIRRALIVPSPPDRETIGILLLAGGDNASERPSESRDRYAMSARHLHSNRTRVQPESNTWPSTDETTQGLISDVQDSHSRYQSRERVTRPTNRSHEESCGVDHRTAQRDESNTGIHSVRRSFCSPFCSPFCSHLAMHGASVRAIQELAGRRRLRTNHALTIYCSGAARSTVNMWAAHEIIAVLPERRKTAVKAV